VAASGKGCVAEGAGVLARIERAPGTGAVKSLSSMRKSKADGAMGVVDMSEKGKKDSSKTTCREMRMRLKLKAAIAFMLQGVAKENT
jgi:hypothetical protein